MVFDEAEAVPATELPQEDNTITVQREEEKHKEIILQIERLLQEKILHLEILRDSLQITNLLTIDKILLLEITLKTIVTTQEKTQLKKFQTEKTQRSKIQQQEPILLDRKTINKEYRTIEIIQHSKIQL